MYHKFTKYLRLYILFNYVNALTVFTHSNDLVRNNAFERWGIKSEPSPLISIAATIFYSVSLLFKFSNLIKYN